MPETLKNAAVIAQELGITEEQVRGIIAERQIAPTQVVKCEMQFDQAAAARIKKSHRAMLSHSDRAKLESSEK